MSFHLLVKKKDFLLQHVLQDSLANCARPVPRDGSVTSVEACVLQKCADQYCDHVKGCFLKIENTTRLFASGKTNNKRGKRNFLKMFFISSINLFFF